MPRKLTALALQGGGSHGAYTWGVLDRLLEDPTIEIEAISGASAGAMNAAVLAYGHTLGGREGAREALDTFWTAVSARMAGPTMGVAASLWPDPAKAYMSLTHYFSPYQLNPLNLNPLRDILEEQIDFERLRAQCRIRLFVSATRVRDGGLRVFTNEALTLEALLASASLPALHHSVEVDGEAYWDGGLTANPPVSALVYHCKASEIVVVVLLNAAAGAEVPSSAEAIRERFAQVSFGSTLASELQSLALAKAEADRARFGVGRVDRRLRRLELHILDAAESTGDLEPLSRLNTDAAFMTHLRDEGRRRAAAWLATRGARALHRGSTRQGGVHASGKGECAAG